MQGTFDRMGVNQAFRLARQMRRAGPDPASVCLQLIEGRGPAELQEAVAAFEGDAFDYVVASIYTLLLSDERRKELGAYFTPPHLVGHLLHRLVVHGLEIGTHSIHDPAAGGAAFVVPLVRLAAKALLAQGTDPTELPALLAGQLSGMELDSGLARVANALVARTLRGEFSIEVKDDYGLVQVGDNLTAERPPVDVVVGNPPYAKVGATRQREWAKNFPDILGGQLNLYALFLRRSVEQVRPGGLVGFVVPTSFLHGPEFRTLRSALLGRADLLRVDLIEKRTGVFLDVVQDACLVVFRRRRVQDEACAVPHAACGSLHPDGTFIQHGAFVANRDGSPWVLPSSDEMLTGGYVLADYGYRCSVGYLVVNRQRERLSSSAGNGRVPLVRAACVRSDGSFDILANGGEYVTVPSEAKYVVRKGCVAIQRTANRKQARRINAAEVPARVVQRYGGLVGENHVLFLVPIGAATVVPTAMARLMNSAPVNARWGRMCGTISLSAKLLAALDLPHPHLIAGLKDCKGAEVDDLVSKAYANSPGLPTMADGMGKEASRFVASDARQLQLA